MVEVYKRTTLKNKVKKIKELLSVLSSEGQQKRHSYKYGSNAC